MILLTYIFYSFAAFACMFEIIRLLGFNALAVIDDLDSEVKAEQEYNKQVEAATVSDELFGKQPKYEAAAKALFIGCGLLLFTFAYWSWALLGLMSSQWPAFVVLITLSLIYWCVQKLVGVRGLASEIARRIDAIISIIILMFILVNRFHLGWWV